MGNGNSTKDFTFENRENIVLYRICINHEVVWTGSSQDDFHKQYKSAFDKYIGLLETGQLHNAIHSTGMMSLERFYGIPISKSNNPETEGLTRNFDFYQVEIRQCGDGRQASSITAWEVINGRTKGTQLCIDERFPSTEEAVTKTIEYLNSKNF
ncbi:Hypothetical protein HVR_LOCUS1265 [uncultured virus]|nr:Hypothetical protein HVR_LOCUS1265 [uncultured virus]